MIIKRIKIKGFKSIAEELVIDFSDLSGLCKIVGSVGSGKTSIGEAILYGLYGAIKGKNLPDIISLKTKELYVEIELESFKKQLIIKRGMKLSKSGKASNTVFDCLEDGNRIVFSNKKEAQQILERDYYDTNKLSIELLCIISFNNFKSLLNISAKDRNDFLNQIFGLYILQEYSDKFKEKLKECQKELQNVEVNDTVLKSNIDTLGEFVSSERIDLNELREKYRELQTMKESLEACRKTETGPINEQISRFRAQLDERKKESIEVITLGKKIASELKIFESGNCPTCHQPAPEDRINDMKQRQSELKTRYVNIEALKKGITGEVESREKELEEIYNRYTEELNDIKEAQSDLKNKADKQKQEDAFNKSKEEKIKKINIALEENHQKEKELNLVIDKYQRIYNILTSDIKKSIISSFIPAINKNVNNYCRDLGIAFNVEFDDAFEPVIINTAYNQPVSISTLSTGQGKAIDTCLILGVLDALLNKINFNITFFDELMSNMDAELRDDICRVLKKNMKKDHIVFIINHAELNDEYFSNSIKVENKNGSKYIFE